MTKRAYRQLQETVPHADTPAHTAALRSALVMMLHDEAYPEDEKARAQVEEALAHAGWTDETRHAMTALALRWAQDTPWVATLRQAIRQRGEEETQPPPSPYSTERINSMTTTIPEVRTYDNESRSMVDLYGDPHARQELHRQKELMQAPPYNTPPSKLDDAYRIVNDGRVTLREDHSTVKGSKGDTYTVVNQRCNCKHAQVNGLKHGCYHAVAVTLHQRTQQALAGLSAPSQFALPASTEQDPGTHMVLHSHVCPTCQRDWDCRALCATMSVDKMCPTCASLEPQDAPQTTITTEEVPMSTHEPAPPLKPLEATDEDAPPLDAPLTREVTVLPPTFASVTRLETQLDEWGQTRMVIARFLKRELKEGLDYGPIHIGKECKDYQEMKVCTKAWHWSKNTLFKPGSEKVAGLLQLRPTFERDVDTWEMLGKPAGVLCLRCLLLTPSGEIAGEGRGARHIEKDDRGNINKAVKQAQKSAQIDAVLRTIALSDVFTQDLESTEEEDKERQGDPPPVSTVLTPGTLEEIKALMTQLGFTGTTRGEARAQILAWTGLELNAGTYRDILAILKYRQAQLNRAS